MILDEVCIHFSTWILSSVLEYYRYSVPSWDLKEDKFIRILNDDNKINPIYKFHSSDNANFNEPIRLIKVSKLFEPTNKKVCLIFVGM